MSEPRPIEFLITIAVDREGRAHVLDWPPYLTGQAARESAHLLRGLPPEPGIYRVTVSAEWSIIPPTLTVLVVYLVGQVDGSRLPLAQLIWPRVG